MTYNNNNNNNNKTIKKYIYPLLPHLTPPPIASFKQCCQ